MILNEENLIIPKNAVIECATCGHYDIEYQVAREIDRGSMNSNFINRKPIYGWHFRNYIYTKCPTCAIVNKMAVHVTSHLTITISIDGE